MIYKIVRKKTFLKNSSVFLINHLVQLKVKKTIINVKKNNLSLDNLSKNRIFHLMIRKAIVC